MSDPLRDYMRALAADGYTRDTLSMINGLSTEDLAMLSDFLYATDTYSTKNAGLLADLTDAIYGKGTAEAKGYPRGMVAKVKRVFNRLRRMRKSAAPAPLYFLSDNEAALIAEVK